MSDISYTVTNNEKEMQFEVQEAGEKATLTYRFNKQAIVLMHTAISEILEGKGIASALAREAFRYAAEHKKPVVVYCTFVAGFIQKHPEYQAQLDRGNDKS